MALSETTRVSVHLGWIVGTVGAGGLGWMIYMQLLLFQVKEDVAVIKAVVVPAATSQVASK